MEAAVIAPISASGGVGKTTMAAHMARAAAVGGSGVLLADLDPSAGLLLLGDAEVEKAEAGGRTIGDALSRYLRGSGVEPRDYVEMVISGVLNKHRLDAERRLPKRRYGRGLVRRRAAQPASLREGVLRGDGARRELPVIVDMIPFYERRYAISSFYSADKAMLVAAPYGAELSRVRRMLGKLKAMMPPTDQEMLDPKARLLINEVAANTREEGRLERRIAEVMDADVLRFSAVIHDSVEYTGIGRDKMGYEKDRKARREVESLMREVEERLKTSAAPS